jgi:hypothetical protein
MLSWQDSPSDTLGTGFVCRVSGAPVNTVSELRAARTRALIDELLAAEAHLHAEREAVSAILFYAIGAAGEDGAARKRLIALKREWFNLRPVPAARVEAALGTVASAAAERARGFGLALTQRDALAAEARAAYAAEVPALRDRFRSLLADADFLKGLLISSRALHGATARYVKAGGELSGKEEKTERGLLRYYTRMATKATPFSTFCAILPGAWVEDDGAPDVPRFRGDPRKKRSFVRVNKMLYGLLLDHLKTRPAFRRALEVEPNPTLRNEGGKLVYLTALEGREVFQRLNHNEVLDLIGAIFGGPTSPTLADLIAALSADPQIDATPEEAEAYLDRLIEIGFLRFRTGIREQDADWDVPFRQLLDRIDDEHAARSSVLLAHVRERTDAYGAAPPEERAAIRDEILAATTAAFEEMELKGRLRRDMPFYEDATGDATAEVALTPGVRRAFAAWESWVRLTTRLAWPRPEQATMRHFFDTFYRGERASVPLLQFYEDFFREHFKAHVEKEAKMRAGAPRAELEGYNVANPFELEFIAAMAAARARLTEAFALRWREAPDAAEISVTAEEVEEALRGVENSDSLCRSVGSFAVLAPRGDDPLLVLGGGSYTVGYGKYFSRFLYMLPDEVQEMVRRDNAALTGELLAEICGDAQFNANLHPPLLRWEISYPTGESGAADEQLRSSDLRVELSPEDPHNLLLRHAPTGARVVPVDLGFLNPRMRPPLYQLLSRFTPPATFAPLLPETPDPPKPVVAEADTAPAAEGGGAAVVDGPAAEAAAVTMGEAVADTMAAADTALAGTSAAPPAEPAPAPRVTNRPRIVFGGQLVLSRRRWTVPGVLFPQRAADESPADFFIRAERWRREHGIPEASYLRIHPTMTPRAAEPGSPAEAAPEPEAELPGYEAAPEPEAPEAADGEAPAAEDGATPAAPRTAGSRDLLKPQFIDFANPLLVGLLGKMAANLKQFTAVFEECLPEGAGLARHGENSFATELVVQLNFPAGALLGATPALAGDRRGE